MWIALIVIALLVIWTISIYNSLVRSKLKVDNAWSQIDVQLQRRFDLIPNFVETVKGYASHESETFEKIAKLRTSWANAGTVAEKADLESKFITEFLNAEKIDDDKYKTKVFKNTAENWITNALSDNIKKAEEVRSILNYTLKEKHEIDVNDFVENSIQDNELKQSFKEHMEDKGLEESFNIDKKWIEKKLKKRSIKTDNGFDIKGDLTDFEDPMKYSLRQNPDGSIDIVIKNVRFYEEK